ncbi:hypothetical protein [Pseudomonas coronafaciens]|uniref:hypothetical protein n=1 Tax=Pseudomonas coronafaciens TaxID=53409 RepID=UPI001CC1E784|nr:hypothetical protein [Pseudomonas coronafaciens]
MNTEKRIWVLLPQNGKGRFLDAGWVYDSPMSSEDKKIILDILIYYARTKAASTAVTVATNIKLVMANGIPLLAEIKASWSSFCSARKKGVNQFFSSLCRLGYSEYERYHDFTVSNLDKEKSKYLDPRRGALSVIEFDSLARKVNLDVRKIDWLVFQGLGFYQSTRLFSKLRNAITNKLILCIVRRPAQLAMLKWSDLIPVGTSFHDQGIKRSNEISCISSPNLQLRIFSIKSEGVTFNREFAENYPVYLSAEVSNMLVRYKKLVADGVVLLLGKSGRSISVSGVLAMMDNMPMFPDTSLFDITVETLELFQELFTSRSSAYHVSGSSIAQSVTNIKIFSERTQDALVTSNRIRHTVLTRGAQDGLDVAQLAKITGVTVPAARHYIDLNYTARRMIDDKFVGNAFLKAIFCTDVKDNSDLIVDHEFRPVGAPGNKTPCETCSTVMGRPLGCYGCPNFRPILEADHLSVLDRAEAKLNANRSSLIGGLNPRNLEKLERQISWLKFTIAACDNITSAGQVINAE